MRRQRWSGPVLVVLLCGSLLLPGIASPSVKAADCATFPETGKTVCDRFLAYWEEQGGLAQQGLPLTDIFFEVNPENGRAYPVQYFERARFEQHAANPPPYDVLLGLLGREQLATYSGILPPAMPGNPLGTNCGEFPETGKRVCGEFLDYWQEHGGLAQQGYPLTDLILETNPTDGKQYPTQYFERARFEYHVGVANAPGGILLGLVGREQFLKKFSSGTPLFRDPLTHPTSGWGQASYPEASIGYASGGYRIHVTAPLMDIRTVAPIPVITDARIEVDAARIGGPDNNAFDIVCRVWDSDNYYRFEIRSNGQYSIARRVGGVRTDIISPGPTSTAIRTDGATNHIRADCVGNRLALSVNGQLLLEVTDNAHPSGGSGIWAGTPEFAGTDVLFTNFTIYTP